MGMKKGVVLLALMCCAFEMRAVGAAKAVTSTEWPFAILRSYGAYEANRDFLSRVFAAQERHPGLVDEIWFCANGDEFGDPEAYARSVAERNLPAKEPCRRLGIRFSFQAWTLGHQSCDARANIPEDAWMVTDEGRVTATASYPPNYLVESPPRIVLDCSDLILDALPAVIAIVMGVNTPETASVEFLNTPMRKVHYTAFEMDLGISADEDKEDD